MSCDFCQKSSLQHRVITNTPHSFTFPTKIPIVPGHVLVCPKRHIKSLSDLSNAEKEDLLQLIDAIQNALRKTVQAEGFNLAWNEGDVAGQTVPHLHVHVVPRKPGDQGITEYEPRRFLYRPDKQRDISPEQELIDIANEIRRAMAEKDQAIE